MRDHYAFANNAIHKFNAKPMDVEAERALQDPEYKHGMIRYGQRTKALLDPIWEEEIYSGKLSVQEKTSGQ